MLDCKVMKYDNTEGGSSVPTADFISLYLLSSGFHLRSVVFAFQFLFKQWMVSEKHTFNYNSCHFKAAWRSEENGNL